MALCDGDRFLTGLILRVSGATQKIITLSIGFALPAYDAAYARLAS